MTWFFGLAAALHGATARAGDVNLEWRTVSTSAGIGEIVHIGLYAVSADGETQQSLSGMDVIVRWDANVLQLLGVQNNGPYAWLQSTFFSDTHLDGLNDTWTDGDAFYTALANFMTPAQATPNGLLVTTFRFLAVGDGSCDIEIVASVPQNTQTVIYGSDFVGQRVTGALGTAGVIVCPPAPNGDMNHDGAVNGSDIAHMVSAVLDASTDIADVCFGDFDHDGVIDPGDVTGMTSALLSVP